MGGRVRKGAITKAHKVRAEHGVALDVPMPDLLRFVERGCGVPVVILADLGEDLAGAYLPNDGRPVIFLNGADSAARMRFTLAHELGHHVFNDARAQDTIEGLLTPGHWREVRANAFAAELLIPEPAVRAWASGRQEPASVEALLALAGTFGTSLAASAVRLATAGLISAQEHDALKAVIGAVDPAAPAAPTAPARLADPAAFEDALSEARRNLPRYPPRSRLAQLAAEATPQPAA